MFDDSLRLQENPRLLELLTHYASLGAENYGAWQDRLMQMDGMEARELSKLHGELLAFEWIEQNVGQTAFLENGGVPACYRITLGGLREVRRFQGVELEVPVAPAPENVAPKFKRKKKEKCAVPEVLTLATGQGHSPGFEGGPSGGLGLPDAAGTPVLF